RRPRRRSGPEHVDAVDSEEPGARLAAGDLDGLALPVHAGAAEAVALARAAERGRGGGHRLVARIRGGARRLTAGPRAARAGSAGQYAGSEDDGETNHIDVHGRLLVAGFLEALRGEVRSLVELEEPGVLGVGAGVGERSPAREVLEAELAGHEVTA